MKILIIIISIIFLTAAIIGAALTAVWLSIKFDCTPDRCRNCCYFRGACASQVDMQYRYFTEGAQWADSHSYWHDLRKDPNDLPEVGKPVLLFCLEQFCNILLPRKLMAVGQLRRDGSWLIGGHLQKVLAIA